MPRCGGGPIKTSFIDRPLCNNAGVINGRPARPAVMDMIGREMDIDVNES